jgi:hypothetical protein
MYVSFFSLFELVKSVYAYQVFKCFVESSSIMSLETLFVKNVSNDTKKWNHEKERMHANMVT